MSLFDIMLIIVFILLSQGEEDATDPAAAAADTRTAQATGILEATTCESDRNDHSAATVGLPDLLVNKVMDQDSLPHPQATLPQRPTKPIRIHTILMAALTGGHGTVSRVRNQPVLSSGVMASQAMDSRVAKRMVVATRYCKHLQSLGTLRI